MQRLIPIPILLILLASGTAMPDSTSTRPTTQPWATLLPNLTDEQIRQMPTEDLAKVLFDSGVPSRVILASNTTAANGIRRLERDYPGFHELFSRPDCWNGLIAVADFYSMQLSDPDQINRTNGGVGLVVLPDVFAYPPLHDQIVAHRRELLQSNIKSLAKLRKTTDNPATALAAVQLVKCSLAIESDHDPARAKIISDELTRIQPHGEKYQADGVNKYIDEAVLEFQSLVDDAQK